MTSGLEATVQQLGIILQAAFILVGLAFAFAGRYVHDLGIYLSGFVAGAWGGLTLAPAIVTALNAGTILDTIVTAFLVLAAGSLGATLAWQAYAAAVYFAGMTVGYFALTMLLGLEPVAALGQVIGSVVAIGAMIALAAGIGFLPGVIGLLCIVSGVAVIIEHDRAIRFLRTIKWADEPDADGDDITDMGVIRSTVVILIGLFIVVLQVSMWLFPGTSDYLLIGIDGLTSLPSEIAIHAAVFIGSLLSGLVGWVIHRVALAVYTAGFGAVLVTVSTAADDFLLAILNIRLQAALNLIEPFSLIFLAVFLTGSIVQLAATTVE